MGTGGAFARFFQVFWPFVSTNPAPIYPGRECKGSVPVADIFSRVVPADMSRFFAGMFCGALLLFVVMHYHVVHGNNGVVLVPKISNNLSGIYTDIRKFELEDWKGHKPLAAAIMRSNQAELLKDSAERNFGDSVRRAVDDLFGSNQ